MIQAQFDRTFAGWREEARRLLGEGQPPDQVMWSPQQESLFAQSLFGSAPSEPRAPVKKPVVPPGFIELATLVAAAKDEDRWDLLYRILFRLQYENAKLLEINVDPDVHRAQALAKSVRRDIHKMHAFVRFKKVEIDGVEMYMAWHKPEHYTVELGTPFFARRFGDRPWTIFTPYASATWDLKELKFGPGLPQNQFAHQDEMDDMWKTYYRSIFNPARLKIKAMKAEMAPKYWSSLPEASLIHELIQKAPQRLQTMAANKNIQASVDPNWTLPKMFEEAKGCQACPLYARATQVVFGQGDPQAELMIVGEQPGDQEDLSGLPFQGPAGEVLQKAFDEVGLVRESVYLTNAVKHFKWEERGKMRLHKKPSGSEMHACKPWLEGEIARVNPRVILALGATAATAVLGRLPKITQERGVLFTDLKIAPVVLISWHPSAILRSTTEEEASTRRSQLVADLMLAKSQLV